MEIMLPNKDFDFNSARSTPYTSAPSTPKRFGELYYSAPPSPGHLSEFYRDFDDFYVEEDSKSCIEVPIGWEEENSKNSKRTIFEEDFAFDVSGEFERVTLPAEELFDGGKIKPLRSHSKLKPELLEDHKSHESKNNKRIVVEQERGRNRNVSSLSSSSSRRTRSVSPYRVSKYPWEEQEEEEKMKKNKKQSSISSSSKPEFTTSTTKSNSKKWSLKDFFLFRSASEGRASSKDPLRKYTALFRKHDEVKSSSFRSIDQGGSTSSKRRGHVVSAHEKHYTKNRANSENLKKKTFLPYKQGILGRLSFNPAVHAISNGFGFSKK